jgi:hypothetical protein
LRVQTKSLIRELERGAAMSEPICNGMLYLSKRVVELVFPRLEDKGYFTDYFIPHQAASLQMSKEEGQKAFALVLADNEITHVVYDFTPYTTITVMPFRVSEREVFKREQFDIPNMVEDKLRSLSYRLVNTINSDIHQALNGESMEGKKKDGSYGLFVTRRPIALEQFSEPIRDETTLVASCRYTIIFFPDGMKKPLEGLNP